MLIAVETGMAGKCRSQVPEWYSSHAERFLNIQSKGSSKFFSQKWLSSHYDYPMPSVQCLNNIIIW